VATPVTGTVVTTKVDGAPQRVVRAELIEHLDAQSWGRLQSLPRALRSAHQFRDETGTSLLALHKEGRAMKKGNDLTWSQVVMAANAPVMTKAALVEGRPDVGVLPTGQVVGLIDELPSVQSIIDAVMSEANDVLAQWGGGPA
jgi:NAD(P)H-dependent flavin oxidoreductase YrpB (nitropropane dioxygenase family)